MADITYLHSPHGADRLPVDVSASSVPCLRLVLKDCTVLLPNVAVAEVVGFSVPEPLADAPAWLLGIFTWREHRVPLISFEAASGGEPPPPPVKESRIAVLNTLNGNATVPYIALLTQGIPRLQVVKDEAIQTAESAALASVAGVAELAEEILLIPDIDDLERRLSQLS